MQTLNSLISVLFTLLSYVEKEVKNVLALGLTVKDDVMQAVLDGREFRDKVNEKGFATQPRVNFLKRNISDATRALVDLQFRFLTSRQVKEELKEKTAGLRPEVWDRCGKDIAAARSIFESVRDSKDPQLDRLRDAYLALTSKLDGALKYQIQFTIEETLKAKPPVQRHVHHKNHEQPATAEKKGDKKGNTQKQDDKRGGWGQSKKSKAAQRRRAKITA